MIRESNPEKWEEMQALSAEGQYIPLRNILIEMQPADIAEFLDSVDTTKAALIFRTLPKDIGIEVFAYFSGELQEKLVTAYSDLEMQELIEELFVDDLVDFLEELPATVAKRVLRNTPPQKRAIVNKILQYPEDSAGSKMTTEYVHLRKKMTVAEALKRLRTKADEFEMIYTCYVTTADRILEGVTTVREILAASDNAMIEDIMETSVVSVYTTDDQEVAANAIQHYDLLAVPVVDQERRLVGIITVDDAVDVLRDETTEDLSIMAAVQPSEKSYLKTGVFEHAKRRLGWLLLLMISGMINGSILQHYEAAFLSLPLLVSFIPMLTDTGGNAGSQSSGLMIRGIALDELSYKDMGIVLWTELRVALLVGVPLSMVNFIRIYFFYNHNVTVGIIVSLAMLCTVIVSKLVGGALPLLAKLCKMDPAIMATPIITTVVDALSLIVYFNVAVAILGQP